MMKSRLSGRAPRSYRSYLPGPRAWLGAALGILILIVSFLARYLSQISRVPAPNRYEWIGLALNLGLYAVAAWLIALLIRAVFRESPRLFVWSLALALFIAFDMLSLLFTGGGLLTIFYYIFTSALTGAGLAAFAPRSGRTVSTAQRRRAALGLLAGVAMAVYGAVWLMDEGRAGASPLVGSSDLTAARSLSLVGISDPAQPGAYPVATLTYGSGTDRYRPEYASGAAMLTDPVDGSALIEGWRGLHGLLRTRYWGFDAAHLPLNGRVWYPQGEGFFPIVVAVHGNHLMQDFSDPGYDYLGNLLASRGMIFVSVDENFLNATALLDNLGPIPTGLTRDSDARAWLLLEHLRVWREWNSDLGNPFYGKVDLQRVALIGHSRGGNAVVAAALMNRLPPDDPRLPGDSRLYNFGIRAVIALAPTERALVLGDLTARLQDVDYLVIQGLHDGELSSFQGLKQYVRTGFSGSEYHYKVALAVYGANHAQFNSVWARGADLKGTFWPFWNAAQLLSASEQQQASKVFISACLETSLFNRTGYLALLRAPRAAADWLPRTLYLARYADSAQITVAAYEEDEVLETAPAGSLSGASLAGWREEELPQDAGHAVYLAWDTPQAAYRVTLPAGLTLTSGSTLSFALADAQDGAGAPIDLTVAIQDRAGHAAQLPLSAVALLQPSFDVNPYKGGLLMMTRDRRGPHLAAFDFPLALFAEANPQLDLAAISQVDFLFDRTPAGAVYLDDLALRP